MADCRPAFAWHEAWIQQGCVKGERCFKSIQRGVVDHADNGDAHVYLEHVLEAVAKKEDSRR